MLIKLTLLFIRIVLLFPILVITTLLMYVVIDINFALNYLTEEKGFLTREHLKNNRRNQLKNFSNLINSL